MSTSEKAIRIGVAAVSDYLRRSFDSLEVQQEHYTAAGAIPELEEKLRRHYHMNHVLCVSNATTALFVLALALELKNCDFVTTPFTYGATVAGMLLLGNRPQFADIDCRTLALDPSAAEQAITAKTKALLSVDSLGIPADSRALRRLADKYGLWYVSDSSQSFGAKREGLPAGTFADAIVTSFTAGKTVFAGEGGAIITDNPELFQKLIWLSQHPFRQKKELGLSIFNEFAFNGRIHPVAAIWANSVFDSSLTKLRKHQEFCFQVMETLNATGLTVPVQFASQQIEPTFFRLTAEWKDAPVAAMLEDKLAASGFNLRVSNIPIELLYRQHAFLCQYPSLAKKSSRCLLAERQAERRFCLINEKKKF